MKRLLIAVSVALALVGCTKVEKNGPAYPAPMEGVRTRVSCTTQYNVTRCWRVTTTYRDGHVVNVQSEPITGYSGGYSGSSSPSDNPYDVPGSAGIEYGGNGGGPTQCADGSVSNSSGPGTCSWHGGVAS